MKRTLITIALTTLVVLTLIGGALFFAAGSFGGAGAPMESYRSLDPAIAPLSANPQVEFYGGSGGASDYSYEQTVANVTAERLVIQTVDMSVVVPDPKARMGEIADLAVGMGGFVVSSNLYQSTYGPNQIEAPEVTMTIRVPSQRLDEALEKIKEGAVEVPYENRSGEDVTNQYVDLQSRLKAKQDAEKKLLEIMDTATNAEDVLAIYMQIQNIQTEIEVLKGQIKYYEESVALSAVSIRLIAEETVQPIEIGGWKLQGTASDAVQDLIRFTQGFARFLIRFFLSYLPALILIAIPAYGAFIGVRALVRRFGRSKAGAEMKEEEKK